ncbi:hypothetical protein QVD17_29724 [Tagetes erecta]|uniref:Protein kinase domain-containing protein n=1 Tax=Tagetes erecta TaxID=13708 RepID=A0AAD8NMA4_TARER|nr:hypothetical protein QVD17_29724 [Tagetes erecta]
MASASEQLCRHYSLYEIQLATQNFDGGLVIGRGGFGKVYEGHLSGESGISTSVAIKRLDSLSNQGAPEFMAEVETLSKKTDVFAFGVVLFELLSGRHAVLPDDDDDLNLARWAQNCVNEKNLDQIVAPEIRGTLSPNSLKEFVQVAFCCLHSDPNERPTMSEVVVTLQLSLALQETFENYANMKFETYAKPVRRVGFARKMLKQKHAAHHFKQFSYDELKHATRNFRNKKLSDRQGWVFKGRIDKQTDPSRMAIMVTWFHHRPEMDVHELGEFGHPNIHKVIGYCLKGKTLYLVHEFIKERSLKDYLHNGLGELSFTKRVKVVVGVARGLLFLERKQLIVKDWILDTDEIWIDKKFDAKLFYFDVARLLYRLQYPLAGKASQRRLCDVNGLGLLLMEILTGKPVPLDYMGRPEVALAYVKDLADPQMRLKDSETKRALAYVKDLVDPRMRLKKTETERAREILSLILKCTGYNCTLEQALEELEQIYSRMNK